MSNARTPLSACRLAGKLVFCRWIHWLWHRSRFKDLLYILHTQSIINTAESLVHIVHFGGGLRQFQLLLSQNHPL